MTGSGKSSAATAYAQATGLAEFSEDDDIGWLRGWTIRAGFGWLSLARLVRRSLRRALTREPV
ncbi:MAG TPA: adenylate kinase, partial [Arthrobacter sp.]|nr:adenylate kinase [Arthrobacter sp.]